MTTSGPPERGIVLTPRLLWAFASIAAIVAGSLGPWITFAALSVSGTGDGRDGTLTLLLGIVAAVLVVIERARVVVGLVAGVILVIAVVDGYQVLSSREETILGNIEIGWGLIVLALGAAGLLAWAVTEYARAGLSSRRAAWAFGGIVVALVGTTAALAASDRFETLDDESDRTSAPEPAAAASKPTETCNSRGINSEQRKEGDCVDQSGWQVRVVNDSSRLHLDDITVRVVDVAVVDSLRDIADDPVRPAGRFVKVKLEVSNTTNAPLDVFSSYFVLTAAGTENEPDTDALLDNQLAGETIGPGLSTTGSVIFDVSSKAASAITTDANLVVFQPSDTAAPDEPKKRVGFVRLYTRAESPDAAPSDNETSPDAGADQTDITSADDGAYTQQEAIQSPSGRIDCAILRNSQNTNRVECTTNENPTASGETTWWRLAETGSVVRFRQTVFQGEAEEMPYGETYYFYGGTPKLQGDDAALRCTMQQTGITCQNAEHGFRLASGTHETF